MCFGSEKSESVKPTKAPEVLKQEAPEKKTAKPANSLAIGTKEYRTSPAATSTGSYPSLNK